VSAQPAADVSVVLAVRNGADRLADALESIRAQTRRPAQVLLIDGGSTDDTLAIAARFPEVEVHPQEGPRLASAYNTGIAHVRCKHVAFLSYDDVWLPHKLERQLELLAATPTAGYAIGHAEFVVEDGDTSPSGFRRELLDEPRPARIMETLLARRETFEQVGPLCPELSPADDTDWFARATDLGVGCVVVPEVVVRKRVHERSTIHAAPELAVPGLMMAVRDAVRRKHAAEAGAIDGSES
jgi:glycosyltransferase involved in cell wall biosynthesis